MAENEIGSLYVNVIPTVDEDAFKRLGRKITDRIRFDLELASCGSKPGALTFPPDAVQLMVEPIPTAKVLGKYWAELLAEGVPKHVARDLVTIAARNPDAIVVTMGESE